jgi:hypothetical protein
MRTYTVSADGKTMTGTVVYFTRQGAPAMRTNHFNRVRRRRTQLHFPSSSRT